MSSIDVVGAIADGVAERIMNRFQLVGKNKKVEKPTAVKPTTSEIEAALKRVAKRINAVKTTSKKEKVRRAGGLLAVSLVYTEMGISLPEGLPVTKVKPAPKPEPKVEKPAPAKKKATPTQKTATKNESGLDSKTGLPYGHIFTRDYKGETYHIRVEADGLYKCKETGTQASLSTIGKKITGYKTCNGPGQFFRSVLVAELEKLNGESEEPTTPSESPTEEEEINTPELTDEEIDAEYANFEDDEAEEEEDSESASTEPEEEEDVYIETEEDDDGWDI